MQIFPQIKLWTWINIILVIITVLGTITGSLIASSLESVAISYEDTLTVSEELHYSLVLPPVTSEIIFHSFTNNSDRINITVYEYYYPMGTHARMTRTHNFSISPGGFLSGKDDIRLYTPWEYRSLVDSFEHDSKIDLTFHTTTDNPQLLSVYVNGRTMKITEMNRVLGFESDWLGSVFHFILFIMLNLFPVLFLVSRSLFIALDTYDSKKTLNLIPLVGSLLPIVIFLYMQSNKTYGWYYPLICLVYYVIYIIVCRYMRNKSDSYHFWMTLGATEIIHSLFLASIINLFTKQTVHFVEFYPYIPFLPVVGISCLLGIVTIVLASKFPIIEKRFIQIPGTEV